MQIRKTNRMSSFDYSNKGGYFLTICCHNKMDFFGEVINNIMELNDFGRIAAECWNQIPKHFTLKITFLTFITISPNFFIFQK